MPDQVRHDIVCHLVAGVIINNLINILGKKLRTLFLVVLTLSKLVAELVEAPPMPPLEARLCRNLYFVIT